MALFGKDSDPREQENLLLDEDMNINFAPLWEDEEQSSIAQYILPFLQVIILIVILFKVWK